MSQTRSSGAGKPYGLERVCRVLEFPRSAIHAQQARETTQAFCLPPLRRARNRSSPMPTCWPSFGQTWRPRPSSAKGLARCEHGCACCGTSVCPGIALADTDARELPAVAASRAPGHARAAR